MSSAAENTGVPIGVIKCNQGALRAVRYNVDGEYVLSCGADRSVKLWRASTEEKPEGLLLSTYQGHSGNVFDARGSCDNGQIVSGGGDKMVSLWDVSSSRMIRRFRGHNGSVTCVQFSEESSIVISGSQDNTVKCWDVRSKATREVQSMDEPTDSITSLAVCCNSILVGSADGYLRLYDLRQGTCSVDCLGEAISSVAISRDMASHLAAVADGTIKLMDRDTGQLLAKYTGYTSDQFKDYKIEACFDYSDSKVLSCSPFGKVFVWDLITEEIASTIKISIDVPVTSLCPHPLNSRFVCSSRGNILSFYV